MKYFIYLFAVLMFSFGFHPNETSKDKELVYKNTKVILNVDDYICSEDQWVYVHDYKCWISGNEHFFFDSAFIAKGQHQVELNFKIPCAIKARLSFSKNGPLDLGFVAERDSCLILNIDESSPYLNIDCCIKAVQGTLHNFFYKLTQETSKFRNKIQLYAEKDQIDSIRILSDHYLQQLTKCIDETTEPAVAYECLAIMKYVIPGVNTSELFPKYASKFDWYPALKSFYDPSAVVPPSEEARKSSARYGKLRKERMQCTLINKDLGNHLDLTFKDVNGKEIATKDISTPYIFVDFWASWCRPCRKEIPNIKQAVAKYKDDLTIYAVSLDNKREAWQKAIKEDSTQEFLQVIGTLRNESPTLLLRQLDIQTIPANFLLDKERRIVAKDLRGEQLMQTLDSLINQ
ncbi:TlpA disulfide reductase family protein [Bacteroides sp. GD17]|jgi:thiol-disulfide isomerase/thioredoxin|uniref:TlpA family protein disulfide reductase n=1 Tax=Bacteroides sp. GD17 TaxID=3139826 RepID=UPI0025DFDB78|nr:TlpA disulfide reductase family protein [uncultured Bacteroides sp.]